MPTEPVDQIDVENPQTPAECACTILYWLLIELHAWGEALTLKRRPDDDWATRFWNADSTASTNRDLGLQYEPSAWCQRSHTGTERKHWQRGLEILGTQGLTKSVHHRGRTKFLTFTVDGLAAAVTFMVALEGRGFKQMKPPIARALKETKWARPLKAYLAALEPAE